MAVCFLVQRLVGLLVDRASVTYHVFIHMLFTVVCLMVSMRFAVYFPHGCGFAPAAYKTSETGIDPTA